MGQPTKSGVARIVNLGEPKPNESNSNPTSRVLAESGYLRLVNQDGWDFVQRKGSSGVVTILGVTPNREVVLVEQYRIPVGARVIEFPAGLSGDVEGASNESLADAARRELFEETGYEADRLTAVLHSPSSAGLTDEIITFFVAEELRRTGFGGGDESEDIHVHHVPFDEIDHWLQAKVNENVLLDARLYTGLYLLKRFLNDR